MKALSQSEYGVIRSLYQDVYSSDVAESILDEFTDEDLDDLTDEYIEEQVTEFFEECLEEGLDIDIVEQTICESVDTELEILTEVTNPAQVAAMRMRDKTSAASGEGQKAGKDAGAMARAKLKVSKEKVGSASPEKKASKLSQIKGVVKKVAAAGKSGLKTAGKVAVKSGEVVGKAAGSAKNLVKDVGSAVKKGYKSTQSSSPSTSSSSSDSDTPSTSGTGPSSSSSDSGSSSTSGTGASSSSSSGGGTSSAAPTKRKDGLLKRGLKKVVRGISKGVSAAAGAVKAGADSLTDRARKEEMNYDKELATIKELYSQVCDHQSEEEIEEGMKPLPKNKMFRKAGNLGRDVVSPSVTDDQRQKAYDRSKKIVKTLNKANEEFDAFDLVFQILDEEIENALEVMSQLTTDEVQEIAEGDLAAKARAKAVEMGRKRRSTKEYKAGGARGTGKNERAAYNLSNAQQSANANLGSQKRTDTDSGTRGHSEKSVKKTGSYDYGAVLDKRDPKKNPKHTDNK